MYRRFIAIILFLFLTCISVFARERIDGFADKTKNIKVSALLNYNVSETYPNCTVTVYLGGTLTLATIYSDNISTVKANPFTADSNAYYFFYVNDGRYDVKFSGTGIVTPFVKSDQIAFDTAVRYASTSLIGLVSLDVAPLLSTNPIAVGVNSPLVRNVYQLYNIEFYGGSTAISDNTAALIATSAAASAAGGKVYIPIGEYSFITGNIVLPSGTHIIGQHGQPFGVSKLTLNNDNASLFVIGELTRDIIFQDVSLNAQTPSINTNGVLFEGATPNSSFRFKFDNVVISDFTKGIAVNATDINKAWQSSYNSIVHSQFENNVYALWVSAINSDWYIEDTIFQTPTDGFGIYIVAGATFNLASVTGLSGVGPAICIAGVPNPSNADTFISVVGPHGTVKVVSSIIEGYRRFLKYTYADYAYPIIFSNNIAGGLIELDADVYFVSSGNTYYADNVSAADDVRIFSTGDKFTAFDKCGVVTAVLGGFQLSGGAQVVNQSNENGNNFGGRMALNLNQMDNTNPDLAGTPRFSIGTAIASQIFIRLCQSVGGICTNKYDAYRDSNGFLFFEGNQFSAGVSYNTGLRTNGVFIFDGVVGSVTTGYAGKGTIYYDSVTNAFQGTANNGSKFNFLGSTTTLIPNRIVRAINNTELGNTSLDFDGTNFTVLTGNFSLDTGSVNVSAGSVNVALGDIEVDNGNIIALNGPITGGSINSISTVSVGVGRLYYSGGVITFTNGDTTPDVGFGNYFLTANAAPTSITMFDVSTSSGETQPITVICGDTNTTFIDGGNLKLAGNLVCTADDTITLLFNGTNWYEISRSVN